MEKIVDKTYESWEEYSTGAVPDSAGYYWLFLQEWIIVKVFEDFEGNLRSSYPHNKLVKEIYPTRWGKKL